MSEPPIRIAHPDGEGGLDLCGCCEGTALSTVAPIENRPSQTAIVYRVGDHARFKASMLTQLGSAAYPALRDLGTRDDDDFSIALADAWAAVLDVLSFYQQRNANEAWIQTAAERLSLTEIARLIGFRLHPGSAAETDLVFLMDDPPGAEPSVADLDVETGMRVQSQPGPDETPQIFETLEPLTARVAWNRLRARQSLAIVPSMGDIGTWVKGQATGLKAGDAILFVGRERAEEDTGSEQWDFRRVVQVAPDAALDRTYVVWDHGLGSVFPPAPPAAEDVRLYVLRQQVSLFGYNAPHPIVLSADQRGTFGYVPTLDDIEIIDIGHSVNDGEPSPSLIHGNATHPGDWQFVSAGPQQILLDAVYKDFAPESWVVLTRPAGDTELYRIESATADAEARYAISGKVTRLALDTDENLGLFGGVNTRRVAVFGASEEVPLAETPLRDWVTGSSVELDTFLDSLPEGRKLVFSGRRAQGTAVSGFALTLDGGGSRAIGRGARLTLLAAPAVVAGQPTMRLWSLSDSDGVEGTVITSATALLPVVAAKDAPLAAEVAVLDSLEGVDATHSRLVLAAALEAAYDRADLSIHANVVRASHGEGTSEILGSGDPSAPFQRFLLKQNPVTYLNAPTETGVASTLTVRIDGVRWDEVPDLYARGSDAHVFATTQTDDGETLIHFGDGRSGARPPAGRDNLVADYRRGLGAAGNVRSGQLSLPLDRPLGLREVFNPLPAGGGNDPETLADARRGAPIRTLTLGRVVSLTDYRDFALGYTGIAKAEANWVWIGETRRIVVTVASSDGKPLVAGHPTHDGLLEAFRTYGDPSVAFELLTAAVANVRLALRVAVDPAYESEAVLTAAETALRAALAYDVRTFAEPLALGRVDAILHDVPGVVAVDVDALYRASGPQSNAVPHSLLFARPGRLDADKVTVLPAEILALSPDPLDKLVTM